MIIGISGGIGSGKSVVSRILRLKGFEVYDCDFEAKRIMNGSAEIKRRIRDEISPEVTDGIKSPDRQKLAEIVFSDEACRKKLNSIVHHAVIEDVERKSQQHERLWVESAILAESGLAKMCDWIWRIETPESERINNIIKRDGCTILQAERRLRAQSKEEELIKGFRTKTVDISNDNKCSLLERIDSLIK